MDSNRIWDQASYSPSSDADRLASQKQVRDSVEISNSTSQTLKTSLGSATDVEKEQWLNWFRGLDDRLDKKFATWQSLRDKYQYLKDILQNNKFDKLDMSAARVDLEKADDKLNYRKPYRVVVIGESGAGKSSIINAILKRKLLISDVGQAITGTATYVYPNAEDVENATVKIIVRDNDDFGKLLNRLFSKYSNLKLSDVLERIEPELILQELAQNQSKLLSQLSTSVPDTSIRARFIKEVKDIATVWKNLNDGKLNIPKEISISEEIQLKNLLMEHSDRNKEGSPDRIIPAIKFVEYKLPSTENSETNNIALRNVVFIDAPGAGARTLRHLDTLQQEVKTADAVILVLTTTRADAENAESMAYLLQNDLLKEYDQADRSRFSNKVFLVVNKIDELRGNEDGRKLLDGAVIEISKIIDPTYRQKYGKDSDNRRYFETMAWFSLLCNLKIQNDNAFSGDAESRYRSFAQLFNLDPSTADPNELDRLSQVPEFSHYLHKFLCEQRIDLMLAEAKSHLRQTREKIWDNCENVLRKNGLEVQKGKFADAEEAQSLQQQQICEQILEQNLKELLKTNQDLTIAMDNWQRNIPHQQALTETVHTIFRETNQVIRNYITDLVNSEAMLIRRSRDPLDGKSYTEVHAKALLLEVQHRFQEVVEDKIGKLASYYIDRFDNEINTNGIYKALNDKSYDKDYVSEIDPVARMKKVQDSIRFDYESICRWVLMYEIVKMPIILPADDSDDRQRDKNIVQGAFAKIVPDLASIATHFGIAVVQNVANKMVPPPLQEFVDAIAQTVNDVAKKSEDLPRKDMDIATQETEKSSSGLSLGGLNLESSTIETPSSLAIDRSPTDKKYRSELLDIDRLVGKINNCIDREDFSQASIIIERQFAFRYSLAISTALLYLDRLFFYERGKYRLRFEEISKKLIDKHLAYVRTGNQDIKDTILQKHPSKTEVVQQAFSCLSALEKLSCLEDVKQIDVSVI